DRLQQPFHEQFLPRKFELALEVGRVTKFLVLRRLRNEDHVGHELDQVILLCLGRHRRNLPRLVLCHCEIALADFNSVNFGDNRVLVLSFDGANRKDEKRQGKGNESGRTWSNRKAGGNENRHDVVLDEWAASVGQAARATIRLTTVALQWPSGAGDLTS